VAALEQEQEQPARKGGAPTRDYVVLEQVIFEETDDEITYAYLEVHRVEARNGTNALRRAFKELRAIRAGIDEVFDEGTLVCIPAGQWKPTPVRAKKRESITVDVG
jgi:hypothetical protein